MSATMRAPRSAAVPRARVERRVSLSRGPAHIVGTVLLAAGLYFLYRQATFPRFANFPNGNAPVLYHAFGVFGINGWTGMGTAIVGGLLLFAAAEHFSAKTMSLVMGLVLAAAAIIALISGNVLGLAAANGWTELGWGIAAVILLLGAMLPARRRVVEVAPVTEPVAAPARTAAPVAEPVAAEAPVAREPVTRTHRITGGPARVADPGVEDPTVEDPAAEDPALAGNTGRRGLFRR